MQKHNDCKTSMPCRFKIFSFTTCSQYLQIPGEHSISQPHRPDCILQDEICSLKARFGHAIPQPKRLGTKANDMSQAGRQILQLELNNLHAEKAQRERKLDLLLGRLRKACIELDEDDNAAAAAAHPSLQHHRSVLLQTLLLHISLQGRFNFTVLHTALSCASCICLNLHKAFSPPEYSKSKQIVLQL